jgi:hypothetical protein
VTGRKRKLEIGAALPRPYNSRMSLPTIAQLRALIRALNYVVSTHAAEELDDDELTIIDLETIVLTGQIIERQRDSKTREAKLVVRGKTLVGSSAETVVKVGRTGQLVVITAYRVDNER